MKTLQCRLLLYAFSFCAFFHCTSSPAQSNSDTEEPETISFRWDSQGKMRPVAGKNVSWQNALMEDFLGGEEVRFWTTGEGRGGFRMYGTRGGVEGTWRANAQAGSGSIYVRKARESTDRPAYIFQSGDAVTIWGLSDPHHYMRYRILEPGQTWEEAVKAHLEVNTYSSQFSLEYNITKVDETDEEVVFAFDCTARYPAKLKPATLADTGIEEKTKPILYERGFAPIHGGLYEIAYIVDNAPVVSQRQGHVFVKPNREADEAQLGVKSNDDAAPFFRLKGGGRAARYEESWTVKADYEKIEKNPGWSSVPPLIALDSPEAQDILDRYLSGLGQMAEKLRGALAFIGSTWHFAADPNGFSSPWFKEFTITSSWNMEDLPSRGSFQRLFAQQGSDELLAAIAQIEKDSWERALRQRRGLNAEPIAVTPGKPIYALININGELRAAVGRPTNYRDFNGPLAVTFVFRREPRGHPSIESIVLIFYPNKGELSINNQHQLTRTDVDKLFILRDTNSTLDTNESQTDQGNVTSGAPVPVLAIPSIPPSDSGSMQKEQRFVAVKISEEEAPIDARVYDTKTKDWLDESIHRLDTEPALGQVLELDGVKAVYVGKQNLGAAPHITPQLSPLAASGEQPAQDAPARGGSQDASTNAQEAASAPAPSITYQPSTAPQAPRQQTWEEQVANTVAQMMASPRMQEVLKKGTRYVAIDVPPSASTPSGEKPVMVLDLQTGRLVDNQVYNVKATPPPTPKIGARYIATPVAPTAQTPRGTFPVMLYDTKKKRPVNNNVYNLPSEPLPGSVHKFDKLEATFVPK